MTTQNINTEFQQLKKSARDLVVAIKNSYSRNIDTNFKEELVRNKIDISDSWLYPRENTFDTPIFPRDPANHRIFSIDNGTANLAYLKSGQIEYKHKDSQTTLLFDELDYKQDPGSKTLVELEQKVTIQEKKDGPHIVLNKEQVQKFLEALKVSKNTDDMLSTVNATTDKITNLFSKKNTEAEEAEKTFKTKTIESILERIESGRPSGFLKSLFYRP